MSILRFPPPSVKPRSAPPCERCHGIGRIVLAEGEQTCDRCEGHGAVVVIEEPVGRSAPYFATVGADELDQGNSLGAFVEQLRREWPESEDDIIVWKVIEFGTQRVAAVLRPLPGGGLSVTWM